MEDIRSSTWVVGLCVALASGCAIFGDPNEIDVRDTNVITPENDAGTGREDMEADAAKSADLGRMDLGSPDVASPDMGDDVGMSACPGVDLQADPENCGACGTSCFGACTAGECAAYVVADQQASPYGIAVDSNHVFWSNQTPGSIWRAPVAGGEPELLAGEDAGGVQMNPRYLHLTTIDVIVSVGNSGTLNHGAPLFRVPKSGGGATPFGHPVGDGTEDFVIWDGTVYSAFPRQDLVNAARLGQDASPLAAGMVPDPYSLAVFQGTLYFMGPGGMGTIDVETEAVRLIPGTETAQVFQGRTDGMTLFIAANTNIFAMGADEVLNPIQSDLFEAESIALSGEYVIFATGVDRSSGSIFRMAKDGTGLLELASQIPHIEQIAADADNVWVASQGEDDAGDPRPGTGRVLRVPIGAD